MQKNITNLKKGAIYSHDELIKLGFRHLLLNGIYYLFAKDNTRLITTMSDNNNFKIYDIYKI